MRVRAGARARGRFGAAMAVGLCVAGIGTGARGAVVPTVTPVASVALIGDTPYADDQVAGFSRLVDAINADSKVRAVLHDGDIKTGASPCSDEFLRTRFAMYQGFDDPFVYTPGDNDWTDCHRTEAGAFNPLERLTFLRSLAYPAPGQTTGAHPMAVDAQSVVDPARSTYVENQAWSMANVEFTTLHVVGSYDDMAPWTGIVDDPAARLAEYQDRRAANLAWLDRTFDRAEGDGRAGVVVVMQADPFVESTPVGADGQPPLLSTPTVVSEPFVDLMDRLVQRAKGFGKPVLLVHGDEHVYRLDQPFAAAPNVTRLEAFGSTIDHWVRLTLRPDTPGVFVIEPQRVG